MIWEPHSQKQQDALFSKSPITLLLTGIQFGKTTVGAMWMKIMMAHHPKREDNFIITAPNYKIMQQSTLPAFLRTMEGLGVYHKADSIFKLYYGGICYLRTNTEPDSIVGITNVRGIWGDEAGKYSLYFWENMQARASFRSCPIFLTTTPYTTNWVYKELLRPVKEGKRDDCVVIQASSDENPYFPKDEFKRRKLSMDPRRFAALYLGEFEKMHGLVYDCFDDQVHSINPIDLPTGTKFYAGVDWGYTDPFVLNVRAITPNGHHFLVSEFYKTGMTVYDMVLIAKQKQSIYDIKTFYCDPSQPGHIEEFSRNGIPSIGADNDIRRGIDVHYYLIKTNKYHVFKTAVHTIDEYSTYHYPEPSELRPDQDAKEQKPVGQDDHCFSGDTLIETINGPKPISEVEVGDLVLTRLGYKEVLIKHKNGVKPLMRVGQLRCTAEHKIFTANRGFVKANELRSGDTLCRLKKRDLTGKVISDTQIQNTKTLPGTFQGHAARERLRSIFIGTFGSFIMAKSQTAIMSTIKMAILTITHYRTLRLYPLLITYPSMGGPDTPSNRTKHLSIWKILGHWLQHGTGAPRGGSGTRFTQKTDCSKKNSASAMSAGTSILTIHQVLSFVEAPARLLLGEEESVYDLTVKDAHEYFAGGYLVHNCMDTERYLSLSLVRSGILRIPKVPEINPIAPKDPEKRIAMRKKGRDRFRGSESW